MNETELSTDRRAAQRLCSLADRISWTRDDPTTVHTGWLEDMGPSGLAFITPTRGRPLPGERIGLTFGDRGPSPRHRSVQVVHAAPYDRFFSIVGCAD